MAARASKAGNEAGGFRKSGGGMTAAAAARGTPCARAAAGVDIMLGDKPPQQQPQPQQWQPEQEPQQQQHNTLAGYPSLSGYVAGPGSFPATPMAAMAGAGGASALLPASSFLNGSTESNWRRSFDSPLPAGVRGRDARSLPSPHTSQNQLQQRQQAQTSYAATEAVGEQQQQQEQAASPVMPAAASTAGADNRQGPQQSLGASSGLWWGAVTRGLRQATGGTQRAGASAADAADSGNSRGPSSFGSNSSSRPLASAASQEVRGAPQLLGPAGPVAEAAEHTADADAAAIAAGSGQAHTRVDSGVLSACGHVNQAVVAQALSEPSPCAPQQAQPAQPAQPGAVEQAVGSEVRRGSPVSPQQVGAAPDVAPPALHSAPQCAEYVGVEAGAEGTNIRMGSRGHLPRWRSGQHLQQLHSASGAALLEDGSSPFTVAGAAGFGLHGDAGATATRTVGCGSSAAGGAGDESMRLALATAVFGAGGNNAGLGRVGGFRRLPFMSAHAGGFGGGGPDNERLSGAFRAGVSEAGCLRLQAGDACALSAAAAAASGSEASWGWGLPSEAGRGKTATWQRQQDRCHP